MSNPEDTKGFGVILGIVVSTDKLCFLSNFIFSELFSFLLTILNREENGRRNQGKGNKY
jgi:hypothetical protein